ncbi:MAG: ankyrin repeat domain-containing protein [Planctomycetota bacterium]|nr:MAG: ankyrin repeat domain-containing protein [Planctomycetota bacterium]
MKNWRLKSPVLLLVLLFVACTPNINDSLQKGDLNGVASILKRDSSKIYARDEDGATLLHKAVHNGHIEIVKLLISQGADVNAGDAEGDTPLHYAVSNGYYEIARHLVLKGADVNAKNRSFSETPLHVTTYFNYINIIKLLVSYGADVNALNKNNAIPLHHAAEIGTLNIVKYLVSKGKKINHKDIDGKTALHEAIGRNHVDVVKELVYQGANVNLQDKYGTTPLHLATHTNKDEIVKYLISQRADVNTTGACFSGYLPLENDFGCTPIHSAAANGNLEIVKYLSSHGADLNVKNQEGNTPLHTAVKYDQLEIVKYLSSHDIDIRAKNKAGQTAYQIARKRGSGEISEFLLPLEKIAKRYQSPPQPKIKTKPYKKSKLASKPSDTGADISRIDFGNYHALVIGNNNYRKLPKLLAAKNDARAVAQILRNDYGFRVKILLDADRAQILTALGNLRKRLTKKDNLLIYYAGHGWLDKEADEGYWLPIDASADNTINWVSNSSITAVLRALEAKHALIVADSCYSGKLGRGLHIRTITPSYLARISKKKARSVLSSGGLEPVIDSGGEGNHSVFASAFIEALKENPQVMDGTQLFSKIRRPVMLNSDQTPEYSDIRKAGHDGGDFLFVRKK